eukprot:1477868-Prorocentrum_lima.AAC.1
MEMSSRRTISADQYGLICRISHEDPLRIADSMSSGSLNRQLGVWACCSRRVGSRPCFHNL